MPKGKMSETAEFVKALAGDAVEDWVAEQIGEALDDRDVRITCLKVALKEMCDLAERLLLTVQSPTNERECINLARQIMREN